ncbi:MAG: RNA-binding domain-containing protein [Parachlamydiales bacterium]
MDILNKPISSLTFKDIEAFCEESRVEGIQLDYKKEIPRDLAKHFASFSNTRGGIIIVGVGENSKTSAPKSWEGVVNDGKLEERIHQFASNVEPIPSYDVYTTDEKNGKVFVLIRIFEGDRTPYYVQNDSNLWVRTGNISKLIEHASPEETELLFRKKDKAVLARKNYENRADEIYEAALLRAEEERHKLVEDEKEDLRRKKEEGMASISRYVQSRLGTNSAMFTVVLQPFYPKKALITPQEILNSLDKFRVKAGWADFPELNMHPIPDGVLNFFWRQGDGLIKCEQIYSYGLIYLTLDAMNVDNEGKNNTWISLMASVLFASLTIANRFYSLCGYQGGVVGKVSLKGGRGSIVQPIVPHGYSYNGSKKRSFLDIYNWDINLDTALLANKKLLQDYYIEKVKELCWSLGYKPDGDEIYKTQLKDNGWLVEET